MTDEATAAAEASAGQMTKETLFPEGLPGSTERKRNFQDQRRQEAGEQTDALIDEVEAPADDLAEAQETEEQVTEAEVAQEAALGRMRLNDFLDAAGVSMEEFYRDIVIERDGSEVTVSQAWDDYTNVKQANDALLRERAELVEKANQAATKVMQPGISPEAQMLANQAQMKLQQINDTDWSQVDPAQAANFKIDLRNQAEQLWQQAQGKQMEHQQVLQDTARKAMEEADRQTRSVIPEWNDPAVRNTDWKAIGDMMTPYGISPQELDTVIDPRWRRFFRDALKAKSEKARIQQGASKIRKVGKTISPGSRAPMSKTPTLEGARAQLQKVREAGASQSELAAARLRVELPDPKPVKKRRF